MNPTSRWMRTLLVAGAVCLVIGALDPLEGSIVILLGGALLTLGAIVAKSRQRTLLLWSCLLLILGIGALWGLSSVGGIGGGTGRSMAWSVLFLPYPVGWVLALVGAYRWFREWPKGARAA